MSPRKRMTHSSATIACISSKPPATNGREARSPRITGRPSDQTFQHCLLPVTWTAVHHYCLRIGSPKVFQSTRLSLFTDKVTRSGTIASRRCTNGWFVPRRWRDSIRSLAPRYRCRRSRPRRTSRLHRNEKSHQRLIGSPAGVPNLCEASRGIKRVPGKSRGLQETHTFNLSIACATVGTAGHLLTR
jgi:hypothetical protein